MYEISEVEQRKIDKIKSELMQKGDNITEIERAYYVYYRLCQFYIPNSNFYNSYSKDIANREYLKQTDEDRKATCYQENSTIAEALRQIGIEAGALKYSGQKHVDGYFKTEDGNIYFFNAPQDLSRAKTGRIIRHFGSSYKKIKESRSREYLEYIGNYFWNNKNINIDLSQTRSITEEQIRQMNLNLSLGFHGITINDFANRITRIAEDADGMRKRFKTDSKPEQIEQFIDILNTHKVPNDSEFNVDYEGANEFYEMLFRIFPKSFLETFEGLEMLDSGPKNRTIYIIKKGNTLTLYEFNERIQKLEKLDVEEVKKQRIINKKRFYGNRFQNDTEGTIGTYLKRLVRPNIQPNIPEM